MARENVVDLNAILSGFGYTFDEINAAQHGEKLQHGFAVSSMPKNARKMTREEYGKQTIPNMVPFAIVKGGAILLSGTDTRNGIGYLLGLAEEHAADLYIGDSRNG